MRRVEAVFAGKTALVTGAASGIGREVALALARRGTRLALVDVDGVGLGDAGREVGEAAAAGGGPVLSRALDVRDEAALAAFARELGEVAILITCAGIFRVGPFAGAPPEDLAEMMEVNYLGTARAIRAVLPGMIERERGGWIVAVSSLAAFGSRPALSGYIASKRAVLGLASVLKHELEPHGIGVSVCCPPQVDTPMLARLPLPRPAFLAGARLLPPARVAAAILAGMERGRFLILCDARSRALVLASRLLPWVVDAYFRRAQRGS